MGLRDREQEREAGKTTKRRVGREVCMGGELGGRGMPPGGGEFLSSNCIQESVREEAIVGARRRCCGIWAVEFYYSKYWEKNKRMV